MTLCRGKGAPQGGDDSAPAEQLLLTHASDSCRTCSTVPKSGCTLFVDNNAPNFWSHDRGLHSRHSAAPLGGADGANGPYVQDPVLIISQIVALQCLWYISLGCLLWLLLGAASSP